MKWLAKSRRNLGGGAVDLDLSDTKTSFTVSGGISLIDIVSQRLEVNCTEVTNDWGSGWHNDPEEV